MVSTSSSTPRGFRKKFLVQKPRGLFTARVQHVGPEHFGIVSVDCAKARSKFMLADFYGNLIIAPTLLPHTHGDLQAALERISQALSLHDLRDLIVAIERTGEYHRPVQRAVRARGWDARLVHPYASKQFRQPADPGNKTDDTDLAGIHRAAVNGFGLIELPLPAEYQELQLLIRHRRDLVGKVTRLCNQLREHLHAAMPGYAELFGADLWSSPAALPIARASASAAAVRQAGLEGLRRWVTQTDHHCRLSTLVKIQAWAEIAPPAHPHSDCLRRLIINLDDDRLGKNQQIHDLERASASLLAGMPYVLLLVIPGINVVSAADFAGEFGPPSHYANANAMTGRAGLMPTRYQSDRVDRANGPLRRCANRRQRATLMQIADNLVTCNHHFNAHAFVWTQAGKDPRWIRVKVAKTFSRIAFAMVVGRRLFPHPCCQPRHYILDKLLRFHREHDTPMTQVLLDLEAATAQLPRSAHAAEAQPLARRLQELHNPGRRGPQALGDILPIVLARLGINPLQSAGDRDPN